MDRRSRLDCALALALPLSKEEFFADAEPGSGKDFVRSWILQYPGLSRQSLWEEYDSVAELARSVAGEAETLGVNVRAGASWDTWRSLVGRHGVVTLFAHWCPAPNDRVEFTDGLRPVDDIVGAIPEGYSGVLDFTVCHSLALAPAVKKKHPRSTVVLNKRAARLDHRLSMYRQAMRLVARGGYHYVDALAEVHLAALRGA